jgi:hypothetical protein
MTAFQALTRLVDSWALDQRLSGEVHTDPDFITVPLPGGLTIRVYLDDSTTKVAVVDQLMCCEWTAALDQAPAAVLHAVLSPPPLTRCPPPPPSHHPRAQEGIIRDLTRPHRHRNLRRHRPVHRRDPRRPAFRRSRLPARPGPETGSPRWSRSSTSGWWACLRCPPPTTAASRSSTGSTAGPWSAKCTHSGPTRTWPARSTPG